VLHHVLPEVDKGEDGATTHGRAVDTVRVVAREVAYSACSSRPQRASEKVEVRWICRDGFCSVRVHLADCCQKSGQLAADFAFGIIVAVRGWRGHFSDRVDVGLVEVDNLW